LNMLATNVTNSRGILDKALWVDTPNKAIRIPYSGLWSINLRVHWNATQAATFQQFVYVERYTVLPSALDVSWDYMQGEDLTYVYVWKPTHVRYTMSAITAELQLNANDYICILANSNHTSGTCEIDQLSTMTIRYIG
jgi:hypothetical protein